ncbi:MAG TPA: family 1 glycosylhydrolase [Nocardioidaceae bacterium]
MRLDLDLDFVREFAPDAFMFGVAYAPYCEGAGLNHPDGPKNTDWTRRTSGRETDEGLGFWTNYADHVRLAASLGLNAFRLGIEWARCQPSASTEPTQAPSWDEDALDHYADMIELVIDHGMQPVVTLHHFTHPLWLGLDIWLDDRGPDQLVEAQVEIVDRINTRLIARGGKKAAHFLVYNEPNLVPLFYHQLGTYPVERTGSEYLLLAFDTMLAHYVKAYDGIHDLFARRAWGAPHVGYTLASLCAYEYDKQLDDLLRLRAWGVDRRDVGPRLRECRTRWRHRIDGLARSQLTDEQLERYERMVDRTAVELPPEGFNKTIDAVYSSPRARKLDYLSLNVYEPFGAPRRDPGETERRVKWERYMMDGDVYRTFILAKNDFNDGLPIYMGENSCANLQAADGPATPRPDGWTRERYLKTYLMEMVRCMKEGVPVKGYLYWTLVDDVHPPRLGLYNYDFVNGKILDTDGFGRPSGRIFAHLIAALRSGDRARIARAFVEAYPEQPPVLP